MDFTAPIICGKNNLQRIKSCEFQRQKLYIYVPFLHFACDQPDHLHEFYLVKINFQQDKFLLWILKS